MKRVIFNDDCEVCKIIRGEKGGFLSEDYILTLKGGWVLNHYVGENNYLGYLVLTTQDHKEGWDKLSEYNLKALGININWIDSKLRNYWNNELFPNDPIEQIYFAYFNDSFYISRLKNNPLEPLHVHIHILPRTKQMLKICNGDMVAWNLLKITKEFPSDYLRNEKLIKQLMSHLKGVDGGNG